MNKHVRDVGIVLECGSKLNREDQFGKLITRFVPDETPSVSQLSDFVQVSLLAGPVFMSQSGKSNENQIIFACDNFPRGTQG